MNYIKVAVYANIDRLLTYKTDLDVSDKKGCRVIVPLGRKYASGVIIEQLAGGKSNNLPEEKIKQVYKFLDEKPVIDDKMIKLGLWASDYYLSAPGTIFSAMLSALNKIVSRRVIALVLPAADLEKLGDNEKKIIEFLKSKRRKRAFFKDMEKKLGIKDTDGAVKALKEKGIITDADEAAINIVKSKMFGQDTIGQDKAKEIELNSFQKEALGKISENIGKNQYKTFLLFGITGSGKTEVYIRAVKCCIQKGRKAIVLVPEIFLTPQMLERFQQEFKDSIAVFHSGLKQSERLNEWQKMKDGAVDIVIGTRSAVFAPFADLGLIIVDEEFDSSFKQENNPKYNARDLAVYRGKISNATVILGSATPSIETYNNARSGKYEFIKLPERIAARPMPEVKIIDLKFDSKVEKFFFLSETLLQEMRASLGNNEQVILFINRRGFSNYVLCRKCGYVEKCVNCDIPLIYHKHDDMFICHYCGFEKKPEVFCPMCKTRLLYKGVGTQKVEEIISKFFPGKKIERIDIDSMRDKQRYFEVYKAIKDREVDILIGTQMIAKGFDFPEVTFVGVVSIDTILNLPDFRSEERVFQLLMQVAGRTGRGDKPGKVIIQTFNPGNTAIQSVKNYETEKFYEEQIKIRKKLNYPPFSRLAQIIVHDKNEEKCAKSADEARNHIDVLIKRENIKSIGILGPAPAPLSRIRGKYRYSIILKGTSLSDLNYIAREMKTGIKGLEITIDPINVL